MTSPFILSPRYRLDDESIWLEGIDPSRNYWIYINGEANTATLIPGLIVSSVMDLRQVMQQFRSLQPQEQMTVARAAANLTIHCVSSNCYAIEAEFAGAPLWHLFDQETLTSLLMTSHPDWQCAPKDIELGRKLLLRSLGQATTAKS